MSGLSVSKESVLKNLASIGQRQSKSGRPMSEDKVKEELDKEKVGVDLGGGGEEEGYLIPIDEMFLPGEMADFQMQLKESKPEDLRLRTAKLTFENRGLKRWIKNAVAQLSNAEKGSKVMLPPLPQDVPGALGVENSNAGVTQMLKEIMPSITQYKLVRDMMKDEDGDSGKDKGMMEYESPDGMKVKMPAGSFMPGMFNPFMMGGQQASNGNEKKEENVTIKVGDKELTGPASSMGWMYQTVMNQQSGNNAVKEATVKIKGEDGEEREVPASAVGAILDLQKMSSGAKKEQEQNITITDENGKEITMPISFYPQYLMQQTMNKQMQQLSPGGGSRRRGEEASPSQRGIPDQAAASMYGMMSEMKDTMRNVGEIMNPEKLGEMAVSGLMSKVEEWEKLKTFFGGGGGEDNEVKKERLKQDTDLRKIKIAEEEKTKREIQRTAQAAADARKFEILMQPPGGVAPIEEVEEVPPGVSLDEAYKKTKAINEKFMNGLQQGNEEGVEEELDAGIEEDAFKKEPEE